MNSKNKVTETATTMPQAYLDMQMTASNYLELGPEKYKAILDHDLQLENIPADMLSTIEQGMRQIMESKGLTSDTPFTGLDIDGFYMLAELLDLKAEMQEASFYENDQFLDSMHMVDSVTDERVILYNLVPTPEAREAAEAKGGRKNRIGPERPRLRKRPSESKGV